MYYVIKTNHGWYLYSGNQYFEYTQDIHKARNFKTLKCAQDLCDKINKGGVEGNPIYPCKVVGIEIKEIEL
jgi:uncharacterized beta-barrel protein YwiB (DUF1934 family)